MVNGNLLKQNETNMKKKNVLFAICLLIVSMAFIGCNSSGDSSIVGKWEANGMGINWYFNSDGSFREEPSGGLWRNKTSQGGMYQVRGKKLILDTYEGGKHYEFTWSKPDKNHLTFGNEASGYWECERVY